MVTATALVSVFATAVLPILALSGVGYLLGTLKDVDVGPLNTVTLYVLSPALIFHSLVTTPVSGSSVAKIFAGVVAFVVSMVVVAELVGRALGEERPLLNAFVLVAAFPNSGNFGIPLSEFAFGAVGRSTAVLFLAAQSVLTYTVGVYVASRGNESGGRGAVTQIFRLPLVYAALAAGVAVWFGFVPPEGSTAMQTLRLTGNAAIPVLLLLLGIELSNTETGAALRRVGPASAMKLLLAPAVGAVVAVSLGFVDPQVGRVFVLETAAPAAVTPLILSIEFAEDVAEGVAVPEYISTSIFVTTLLAIPTLTVLIVLLRAGLIL